MRGPRRATVALLLLLLVVAGAVLSRVGPPATRRWERRVAARLVGLPALLKRRVARSEAPPFAHLAASQVGYGPAMRKQFTSPRPFASFVVEAVSTGAVSFRGAGPARSVQTELLGPFDTVFVGDFSPLSAPGRYRVVADNGLSSFPFTVGADVFDAALRAVQRWFYYQRAFTAVLRRPRRGPLDAPQRRGQGPTRRPARVA